MNNFQKINYFFLTIYKLYTPYMRILVHLCSKTTHKLFCQEKKLNQFKDPSSSTSGKITSNWVFIQRYIYIWVKYLVLKIDHISASFDVAPYKCNRNFRYFDYFNQSFHQKMVQIWYLFRNGHYLLWQTIFHTGLRLRIVPL